MTVPANLAALSTTASSNPPAGTDAVFPLLDDHIRFTYSCLAQLRDQKFAAAGGSITGTTTISGAGAGTMKFVNGSALNSSNLAWHNNADQRRAYIILPGADTHIELNGEQVPFRFTVRAPQSSIAASAATELVRKQEMDTAVAAAATGSFIGEIKMGARLTAPSGYLLIDGKTIGSAASGATARANADTQALYEFLWAFDPSAVPIFTSAGVASTRGASAAADFAANKRIALFTSDGGWFPRAYAPGQTTDVGRIPGTTQAQDIQSHGHRLRGDNSGSGPSGSPTSLNGGDFGVGGTNRTHGYLSTNGSGAALIEPIGGPETRPYNLALPFYIRYA